MFTTGLVVCIVFFGTRLLLFYFSPYETLLNFDRFSSQYLRSVTDISDKELSDILQLLDNKISEIQRKFMTTVNSSNVFNIALAGNFDECQKFVKSMFADKNFRNSINKHVYCSFFTLK